MKSSLHLDKTWALPRAYWGALGTGFALAALGLLFSRFDLTLLGLPLLLCVLVAQQQRPTRRTIGQFSTPNAGTYKLQLFDGNYSPVASDARVSDDAKFADENDASYGVSNVNAEAVQLRVFSPGYRPTTLVALPRDFHLKLSSQRTGPHPTFTAHARGYGAFNLWEEEPWHAEATENFGLPTAHALGQLPSPTRLRGLTGARISRRLGDGGELRDIAPMRPGDSLRRVDWRATGKRSPNLDQLHVRRTFSNAEGIAELVIDSRDDVGPDLETWRGSGPLRVDDLTSLDLARHAAASVASALITVGDRVGLEDLAYQRRPVAAATGQRQLRRIQQALAVSAPHGEPAAVVRPPRLPGDAVIYLFTTLLDDTPLTLAAGWIEQGNPVIVVDTLPKVRPGRSGNLNLAWRITTLERSQRLATLRARSVPVIPWQTADSLIPATELTKIARAQAKTRGRR